MGVNTQRYIRKPLYVDAVRVKAENFDEIAAWCQGEILQEEVPAGSGTIKKYIKVRVHNPKNPRQTKAFIGDWLLYTERGYKVYTNRAFRQAFDIVEGVEPTVHETSPDVRLGNVSSTPEEKDQRAVAELDAPLSEDEEVEVAAEEPSFAEISEEVRAKVPEPPAETELHQSTKPVADGAREFAEEDRRIAEANIGAAAAVDEHHTPQGEPHEYVEATPKAIADAVAGHQPIEQPPVEQVDEGLAVESSPSSPPVQQDPTAGKQVLSVEEQRNLGPERVQELVRSGQAVLEQDLAA